jgi:hypothetical protein
MNVADGELAGRVGKVDRRLEPIRYLEADGAGRGVSPCRRSQRDSSRIVAMQTAIEMADGAVYQAVKINFRKLREVAFGPPFFVLGP